jgi:hypothetical protein
VVAVFESALPWEPPHAVKDKPMAADKAIAVSFASFFFIITSSLSFCRMFESLDFGITIPYVM